jgi:hypothetical protein
MDEWAWLRCGAFQRPTLCITASSVSAARSEAVVSRRHRGSEAKSVPTHGARRGREHSACSPWASKKNGRRATGKNRRMGDQRMPGAQVHGKAEEGPRPPGLRAAGWRVAS